MKRRRSPSQRLRIQNTSERRAERVRLCEARCWRCYYCGVRLTERTATTDHLIALSRGGTNARENKVPACRPCNVGKGDGGVAGVPWAVAQIAFTAAEGDLAFEARRQ